MIFHAFLIKYAEIAIKGKNRYIFEDALVKQMNIALSKVEGEFEVKKEQGRIYVFCPEQCFVTFFMKSLLKKNVGTDSCIF